jgi:hypothetical protein
MACPSSISSSLSKNPPGQRYAIENIGEQDALVDLGYYVGKFGSEECLGFLAERTPGFRKYDHWVFRDGFLVFGVRQRPRKSKHRPRQLLQQPWATETTGYLISHPSQRNVGLRPQLLLVLHPPVCKWQATDLVKSQILASK